MDRKKHHSKDLIYQIQKLQVLIFSRIKKEIPDLVDFFLNNEPKRKTHILMEKVLRDYSFDSRAKEGLQIVPKAN